MLPPTGPVGGLAFGVRTAPLLVSAVVLAAALSACSDEDLPVLTVGSPSAATSPAAEATPAPPVEQSPAPTEQPVGPEESAEPRLTGDGIALVSRVLDFGTPIATARPALEAELGKATLDTGVGSNNASYGVCPGTQLQALEFGDGGLVVLFGDVGGPGLRMYGWALQDKGSRDRVPQARALVGDVSTLEFGVGTAVQTLQDGAATDTLELRPASEPSAASFRLADQSSGFFGYLTGTAPADTVTFVSAGEACGE
jgi:hypothetical protein